MVNPIIEVCANSVQSCIEAQKGGAYREIGRAHV